MECSRFFKGNVIALNLGLIIILAYQGFYTQLWQTFMDVNWLHKMAFLYLVICLLFYYIIVAAAIVYNGKRQFVFAWVFFMMGGFSFLSPVLRSFFSNLSIFSVFASYCFVVLVFWQFFYIVHILLKEQSSSHEQLIRSH